MNEIALRVGNKIVPAISGKWDYVNNVMKWTRSQTYIPEGSFISAWSRRRKIRKWVEIVCDLASPTKRGSFGPGLIENTEWTLAQWDAVCGLWTPALREEWVTIERNEDNATRTALLADFWGRIRATSGWLDAIGTDPGGTAPLCDVVPWSKYDKRGYLIIANNDLTDDEADVAQGIESEDVSPTLSIKRTKYRINWREELGLTAGQIAAISDPTITVHPRYDRPIARSLIQAVRSVDVPVKTRAEWITHLQSETF